MSNDQLTPEDLAALQTHFDDTAFRKDIEATINRHSKENRSNTPDFVLAQYLMDCLAAFDKASQHREAWCGRPFDNGDAPPPPRSEPGLSAV